MTITISSIIHNSIWAMLFILTIGIQQVKPAVFTVTNTSSSGAGSFDNAISSANSNPGADEIQFDPSITQIFVFFSSYDISDDLTINGGSTKVTINGAGSDNVFSISNVGRTLAIRFENLIIRNGNTGSNGAGILSNGPATLTIVNCDFLQNVSNANGGAIYFRQGTLNISNSTFLANITLANGGAIYLNTGTATITNCDFQLNTTNLFDGGAIYTPASGISNLIVTNTTFFNNRATNSGGAIYTNDPVSVVNCTLYQNRADSDNNGSGNGGGIYSNTSLTLKNSIIYDNTANGTNDDLQVSSGVFTGDANLVMACTGSCGTGIIDYTSNPNLATAQTCDGLTYFQPQAPSDAINNGIVDGDTPSSDICGNIWTVGSINLGNSEEMIALPTTLLNFEATRKNEQKILLTWETATEKNNKGFEIEMSEDGKNFQKVALVAGTENSSETKNYQLVISNNKSTYYRLKQLNTYGGFTYSDIIFVKGISQDFQLTIYSNPSQRTIHLDISPYQTVIALKVMDLHGKEKITLNGTQEMINQQLNQMSPKWENGVYIFQVLTNNKAWIRKLLLYR